MKKRYIIIPVLCGLVALLYFPISSYIQTLKIYHKFQSGINPVTDPIFNGSKSNLVYTPEEYDQTSRLFYLCKLWGFVKYNHEHLPFSAEKMDSVLIRAIPKVMGALSKNEYVSVLDSLLFFRDTLFSGKNPYPDINDYYLINNDWMNDTVCLNSELKKKLETIFYTHSGKENSFVRNKSMVGNIRLRNEPEYTISDYTDRKLSLLALFRYWNVINYFGVYKNDAENWDEVLYQSISRFLNIESKKQYHQEIYRLTNQLRDTHASYPPTIDNVVFGPFRPNFKMMCIDSTFVIQKIRVPEYEKEDFQPGDIVFQVDNQDVRPLYDSLLQYVCGGNHWSNQSFGCNAVLSRNDSTTLFTILRGNDTLKIKSTNHTAWDLHQSERKAEKKNEKNVLYHWINDSIAYFNLRSATPDNFDKNYKDIQSASTIILDLRCYPNTHLILNLTNAFVPPNSFFAYVTYPDTRFPGMVRYCKSSPDRIGNENYYKGQIIVLVNEWTQSYSEYTTMALQANPKTITIGNSSSGSDGNISLFTFPGGVRTVFSGVGIYYPDFTPTQRIGVRIDYIVEPTIKDIKNNIDVAYERSINIAKHGNY
ncbi:MAG: peptidase S41 [Bacteroidales bacterium]|jgi:C-terminal processing protease CtpA/Prc|nr:peptidase S41 [Bacteroidales bacterium]